MTRTLTVPGLISTALLFLAGLLALGALCLLMGYFRWWMLSRTVPPEAWANALMTDPWNPTRDFRATAGLVGAMSLLGGLIVALAAALRH